jgi:hypothetical protein
MKPTPLTATLTAVLALGTATPSLAQYVDPQAQRDYEQRVDEYNAQQQTYDQRRSDYDQRRADYADNRAAYELQRADYERARADYDRRYGYGAYVRRYGEFAYREDYADNYYYNNRWVGYDQPYRGYERDYYRSYRNSPCERSRDNRTVGGALIGALAGGAIGAQLDRHGSNDTGVVLGALVGGAIGANVGRSTANCDTTGYYYSYEQTYPYREASYYPGSRSGRYDYDWYARHRCRLAVAPAYYSGTTEYRYVRVCPDRRGRYRITD